MKKRAENRLYEYDCIITSGLLEVVIKISKLKNASGIELNIEFGCSILVILVSFLFNLTLKLFFIHLIFLPNYS